MLLSGVPYTKINRNVLVVNFKNIYCTISVDDKDNVF